ncbi:hypothetical protein MtrunA17_Chr2g0309081 [Medicago truncatula]|uniref:Uncharacterized protein n=1 Tax=Medicago truncatula TaxID=3880 RepID=A2Q3C1_MEDTR|nr:uncharacterized protein LOC11443738 [Medicago truncatula]ABN08121.1 hypothetical protein MtrDRAFT_AC155880g21v2 [Medicago truncatula]AES66079.2 hypothetical protein MTR_2g062280 [Medicago truncatula]RHN74328.1 hypothetical protein MtrunA17_Chr2g0309081 [Medicago truncatula]
MEFQSSAKRHYDITMSRRTRKQQSLANEKPISKVETPKDVSLETTIPEVKEGNENNIDHKSLKQLIVGEEKESTKKCSSSDEGESKGRNSLGEHFTEEEKQLQLVRMQQKDNLQGLKFKKLVRRYAKVLGHMMKSKRDPHLGDAGKKPVFKLSA